MNSANIIRNFKIMMLSLQKKVFFKLALISPGGKVALISCACIGVSLFLPWIQSGQNILESENMRFGSLNAFSLLSGGIGYVISLGIILVVFSICSVKNKQKIHYISRIRLHSGNICIAMGTGTIIAGFQCFFVSRGLLIFGNNLSHGQGIILAITGAIFLCIAGVMIKNETRKNIRGSYTHDEEGSDQIQLKTQRKDNMKLPF